MENQNAINGKTRYKWPFSIAMLVHQAGSCCIWGSQDLVIGQVTLEETLHYRKDD
jgi:hypothetical protein